MRLGLCFALVVLMSVAVLAQSGPPAQQGERQRMASAIGEGRGTLGVIKEINSGLIILEGREGKTETINVSAKTTFRKDGQTAKFEDFKVGDRVAVMGERKGDTWDAQLVASGNRGGMQMSREDMGKKFIAGQVTKIDETKLTVHRIDGVDQVIEVDENTSFRNDKRESITLADIKVGDNVMGRGELKDGTFFPTVLNVGAFPMMQRRFEAGPNGLPEPPKGPEPAQKK